MAFSYLWTVRQNSWYLTLLFGFSIQNGLSRHYFYLRGPGLALWPAWAPRAGLSKVEWKKHSLKVDFTVLLYYPCFMNKSGAWFGKSLPIFSH